MEDKKVIISSINIREDRLPPGQKWIDNPIPYDISVDTNFDTNDYFIEFFGEVTNPTKISYYELLSFPVVELIADFHCVTHWSVKDIHWEGVQVKKILEVVQPKSKYVLIHSKDGYTTNTLTEYLFEEDVIIAYKIDGNILPKKYGFPLRLVIPKLYAWKSAKYVCGFEFLNENKAGYWEQRGYHLHGDPWKNERYSR